MANDLRFIVLNTDPAFATSIRETILRFSGVKIVAEVDEPTLFGQALQQFPVDVALVNLDPAPEAMLPIVGDVIAASRQVAVFAVSQSTDGPLILKAMRLGVREFLPKPIDPKALHEAIERVAATRLESVEQGSLITVVGAAGGVGATLVATNLAVELAALTSGGVTVADLDYRYGQVATMLDVDPTYTLADLCGSPEHLETQVLDRALAKHDSGVRVLSRPQSFTEAETVTAAACVGVFSTLLEMNEYVVADGPTRFDPGAHALLAVSDLTIIVVQLSVPSVRNASRILDSIRQSGFNVDRTRVVCNRVGRDPGHLSIDHLAETLNTKVFATIPDDVPAVNGAVNLGEPLLSHSPKSKVRLAIQEIAQRLHVPPAPSDDKDARKQRSLIGRIFAPS